MVDVIVAGAKKVRGLVVGGRLGEYRYYDMDRYVAVSLEAASAFRGRALRPVTALPLAGE